MSDFIKGEYKIRVDGTSTGRGPVIYVPNYWDDGEEWEFCEFESTEVRQSLAVDPKAKWKPTEEHDQLMATAFLFAAAPKLLQACKSALRILDRTEQDFYRVHDKIMKAIELATNTSAPVEKMIGGRPESEA